MSCGDIPCAEDYAPHVLPSAIGVREWLTTPLRSPLCWYGGKGQIAHRIVALLPPHAVYLEPFAGGLSVFFGKRPALLETINDVDDGVVQFYRVMRDPEQCAAFQRLAELTPYARAEYEACRARWHEETDPVRRAWAWFIMARHAYGGGGFAARTGWKAEHVPLGRGSSWGYRRRDTAGSAGRRLVSAIEGLGAIHTRLQGVQIECRDWRHVLAVYGVAGALVYCDPPYVLETRSGGRRYAHEMTLADHHALTAALLASPALCVLSGYRHEAVHGPLERAGWERIDLEVRLNVARPVDGSRPRRLESVWRNPAAVAAWRQARAQLPLPLCTAASDTPHI